ncbi:MAG: excinuclease ABC subunit UvrA [Nitrospirae bacterium]|nr:excinuclease ABC subunit UvrA [Nitrospirota bacterium]
MSLCYNNRMSTQELIIEGARQNNLRNISLCIPHNKVIAVTGVSGSGKSSLAFDTIFAEGQWRFIESLSSYARLFLEKLDRPDVDAILNIRPAIALEQKNSIRGSRSTVGTLTELYDLFRVLFAKVSTPYCPQCGKEIRKWDPSQISAELAEKYAGQKAFILFDTKEPPEEMKRKGFFRAWKDGEITEPGPDLQSDGNLTIVLDRLVIKDEPRLSDSVETAWREGRGSMKVSIISGQSSVVSHQQSVISNQQSTDNTIALKFSSEHACEDCGIVLPEPSPLLFSFNHPIGACPVCKGFGDTLQYDEDLIVPDRNLSLAKGAVDPWNKPAAKWWRKQLLAKGKKAGLDLHKPYADLMPEEKDILFKGVKGFHGIDAFFDELEGWRYKLHVRVFLSRYRRSATCHACGGKRLKKEVLSHKVSGLDIAELSAMPVTMLSQFFADIDLSPFRREMAKELLRQIAMKLEYLEKVGLGYLTLNRYGKTLSGGEYQRINLSNQLASVLTGTLYVLDEPTIGLHARDTDRIAGILKQLAELGNTVIVVEHDRSIIEASAWMIELGPGGGHRGGNVVFSGPLQDFLKADTLTARYLRNEEKVRLPSKRRSFSGDLLMLCNASGNNLKGLDLNIPLKRLIAVTGVSGSGKSSLVVETLYRGLARHFRIGNEQPLPYDELRGAEQLKGIRLIDQSPIGKSPRSNPATYLKVFDHIRKIFAQQKEAKAHGYEPGFFSFNVAGGRCETCKGGGYELMEMFFFEDLYITCEKCSGKRYRPEALRVTFREKNIYDILNLTVEEAIELFREYSAITAKLTLLMETGLGYLRLGQSATTLSGGEAQRLKICAELQKTGIRDQGPGVSKVKPKIPIPNPGFLYILDEPTVGLHFEDVKALLHILNRLVEAGNTVVVIEHNLDVIRAADWVVDIGPEGGDQGGRIVFEGTPDELVKDKKSYTGIYLKKYG